MKTGAPTIAMVAYTNYSRDPRVRREAEALTAAGYRVVFLASLLPGQSRREVINDVEVIKLWGIGNKKNSAIGYVVDYVVFFLLASMHLALHARRYDLVHVNNMPDFLVFAAWLQRLLGKPVIHDVHDLMPELFAEKFARQESHWAVRALKLQERLSGQFATAVLTVEARLVDILCSRGIPRSKLHVLMNLPDESIFRERQLPKKGAADPFVIVYHGTLARRLGLDLAIRAVHRIRHDVPRLEFRIIGAGEERESLIDLVRKLELTNVVQFSDGFVPVHMVPKLIADADVGVVPLRKSSGTEIMLPTKLLEYVSMGIPCIVPRTGTITKYFDEQMVEFMDAEDVDSLANAIRKLYRDPDGRAALARNASERFGRRYCWSSHKTEYVNLVTSLVRGEARMRS